MTAPDVTFGGALAFLLGVTAASLGWGIYAVLGIALFLGLAALGLFARLNLWRYIVVFLALIFFGFFYYNFYLNLETAQRNLVFDEEIEFSGVVVGEPRGFDNYQAFDVEVEEPLAGRVRVLTSPLAQLRYGDLIKIDGRIRPPATRVDKPVIFFPNIEVVGQHRGFWLKEKLLVFKGVLVGQFREVLAADEVALLSGVTFGVRSDFTKSFRSQMSASGTTHLVALSGYNIAILVMAMAQTFGYFLSRRKTFYLTALVIFLFVMMVGAEPSVVRAAIMGFLALLAREVGRIYSMRNAIVLTAATMTLFNPTILIHDVGFQLSFVSLLGLVYLSPALKKLFRFKDAGFAGWRESVLITLSAQLAVMPIIIQVFGEFSLTAILANTLILAFIPLTMLLGFLLASISLLYSYFGFLAAKLVGLLLAYEILVIKFFAALRLPVALPPYGAQLITLLYYAAIVFLIYHFSYRRKAGMVIHDAQTR